MDATTEDSEEKGTNGIAYIIILIFIIIGILVAIWTIFFAPPIPKSPGPPDSNALLAEVLPDTGWSAPMNTSECMKFTFIFPDQPTLDPTVLDGMQGVVTNINNICPFSDEIGAQKYTRTCQTSTCIDDSGMMYTNGDTQTLYQQCLLNEAVSSANPNCDKTLALVSIGFDPSNPDTNVCITQDDDGTSLFLSPCNPADSSQLFAIEIFNTQFSRITNKAGLCVLPASAPVTPGMQLTLQGCAPDQFSWEMMNGRRYQIPPDDPTFVPQQLIYWDQSTQGTVAAIDILNMNLLSMSVGSSNSLILNQVSIDGDEGDPQSAQILDYTLYDFILTQNTIPIPGENVFPFYANIPDIAPPNAAISDS